MVNAPSRPHFLGATILAGVWIPAAILKETTLSAPARLLWAMLAEYQGRSPEQFPLEETLAVWLGIGVRQLQNYMKELASYRCGDPAEAAPLIEVQRIWIEKEGKTRNIYRLRWPPLSAIQATEDTAEVAADEEMSDTQSIAHRSNNDTAAASPNQTDAASPARERFIPANIAPTDECLGNTQSIAHPSDDVGASPSSAAASEAQNQESLISSRHLEVQQQSPPLRGPVEVSAYERLLRGDCMSLMTTEKRRCQRCGRMVNPGHFVAQLTPGLFCENCCPACQRKKQS